VAEVATQRDPELFFAIVAPVGADARLVWDLLRASLEDVAYTVFDPIHLIERLHDQVEPNHPEQDIFNRYWSHMNGGNALRSRFDRNDAFALLCAAEVLRLRRRERPQRDEWKKPLARRAYIFSSLKRREEAEKLREIFGEGLIIVAAYSPYEARIEGLAGKISLSEYAPRQEREQEGGPRTKAQRLVDRDEEESGDRYGQRVSEVFPLADVFVDVTDPTAAQEAIRRFIKLLFRHPFVTPSKDEYAMFFAQAAALRSADLSRQVGAVITTDDAEVLGVGTNEVPKGGGGLYWEDSHPDQRDWKLRYDSSTEIKKRALGQILRRLLDKGWLKDEVAAAMAGGATPVKDLVEEVAQAAEGTDLMNVLEFGRALHAEMAAIVSAARRGAPIGGATLYTTTFPCHICARHIIAAGIERIVFREPYPKSLALGLHRDALAKEGMPPWPDQVRIEHFVGVAPRRFIDMFTMVERKQDGRIIDWETNRTKAQSRVSSSHPTYLVRMEEAVEELNQLLARVNLKGLFQEGPLPGKAAGPKAAGEVGVIGEGQSGQVDVAKSEEVLGESG
jgi:deoxycytidylate deaminase